MTQGILKNNRLLSRNRLEPWVITRAGGNHVQRPRSVYHCARVRESSLGTECAALAWKAQLPSKLTLSKTSPTHRQFKCYVHLAVLAAFTLNYDLTSPGRPAEAVGRTEISLLLTLCYGAKLVLQRWRKNEEFLPYRDNFSLRLICLIIGDFRQMGNECHFIVLNPR